MSETNEYFTTITTTVAERTAVVRWHAPMILLFPSEDHRATILTAVDVLTSFFNNWNVPEHYLTIGNIPVGWSSRVNEDTDVLEVDVYLDWVPPSSTEVDEEALAEFYEMLLEDYRALNGDLDDPLPYPLP